MAGPRSPEVVAVAVSVVLVVLLLGGCGSAPPESRQSAPSMSRPAEPVAEKKPAYATGVVTGLTPITVMKVESGPKSVELMPDGRRLFINDLYGHKNFIFDVDSYQQLMSIQLPDEPVEADFSPDGRVAWVSLYNSSKVLVVDTVAGAVVGEVATGSIPKEVAVSPDGKWVYVANWNSNTVTVIDSATRTAVKEIAVPATPRGICFSPAGDFAYVCIMGGSTLSEVDVGAGHVISRQIPCGSNPRHVVPSADGSVLYVSNNSPGTVTLIDRKLGAVQYVIKVGSQARTIVLSGDQAYLFVCNYGDNTVGCVDLTSHKQVFTIPATMPIGITLSERGDRLFLANYAPPQVTVYQVVR
ncbi:MAG: beta-propeller fold lactonase family protein [Actinobacteria bacterium]|nr:beta-propeller fold lactonase family protein [Actinomycetota bacterium]MBU1942796.1 beta-propeller fold lactonase family protein [Actinomycetota bacterium]MBU2686118.1 beta-propeller fold lactonase family protein [Actinomycetota bacterium]